MDHKINTEVRTPCTNSSMILTLRILLGLTPGCGWIGTFDVSDSCPPWIFTRQNAVVVEYLENKLSYPFTSNGGNPCLPVNTSRRNVKTLSPFSVIYFAVGGQYEWILVSHILWTSLDIHNANARILMRHEQTVRFLSHAGGDISRKFPTLLVTFRKIWWTSAWWMRNFVRKRISLRDCNFCKAIDTVYAKFSLVSGVTAWHDGSSWIEALAPVFRQWYVFGLLGPLKLWQNSLPNCLVPDIWESHLRYWRTRQQNS